MNSVQQLNFLLPAVSCLHVSFWFEIGGNGSRMTNIGLSDRDWRVKQSVMGAG